MDKKFLENLYLNQKLSMMEISKVFGCSVHKIQWWMDKFQIKRRSRTEATYIKRNPNGNPFKIKTKLNEEEKILFGLAVGLYWGEGTKADKNSVRLGNTDPDLIKVFVKFLTGICQVKSSKIKYGLQIFDDIDKEKAMKYWQEKLNIKQEQFLPKIVISPSQGKGTYKKKNQHGVLTVYFCNKKLREWIGEQLKIYQ